MLACLLSLVLAVYTQFSYRTIPSHIYIYTTAFSDNPPQPSRQVFRCVVIHVSRLFNILHDVVYNFQLTKSRHKNDIPVASIKCGHAITGRSQEALQGVRLSHIESQKRKTSIAHLTQYQRQTPNAVSSAVMFSLFYSIEHSPPHLDRCLIVSDTPFHTLQ